MLQYATMEEFIYLQGEVMKTVPAEMINTPYTCVWENAITSAKYLRLNYEHTMKMLERNEAPLMCRIKDSRAYMKCFISKNYLKVILNNPPPVGDAVTSPEIIGTLAFVAAMDMKKNFSDVYENEKIVKEISSRIPDNFKISVVERWRQKEYLIMPLPSQVITLGKYLTPDDRVHKTRMRYIHRYGQPCGKCIFSGSACKYKGPCTAVDSVLHLSFHNLIMNIYWIIEGENDITYPLCKTILKGDIFRHGKGHFLSSSMKMVGEFLRDIRKYGCIEEDFVHLYGKYICTRCGEELTDNETPIEHSESMHGDSKAEIYHEYTLPSEIREFMEMLRLKYLSCLPKTIRERRKYWREKCIPFEKFEEILNRHNVGDFASTLLAYVVVHALDFEAPVFIPMKRLFRPIKMYIPGVIPLDDVAYNASWEKGMEVLSREGLIQTGINEGRIAIYPSDYLWKETMIGSIMGLSMKEYVLMDGGGMFW